MLFGGSFLFFHLLILYFFVCSFYFGGLIFSFYLFSYGKVEVCLSFVFDYISLGFFSSISIITSVVFFYSFYYMSGSFDVRRFVWLVFLFVMSMLVLVFSGNFFFTMLGWDGLGLSSFCLVIFYSNASSMESGLVTVFMNRVGDVFFLLSFYFFFVVGSFSWEFFVFFDSFVPLIFLLLGAITKSAQAPFSAWLPAAMAAPTPVSSLVHSSTLVTAGVYVIIRFNYMFNFLASSFLGSLFLLTMVLAGMTANVEADFKKVIAMSTLSQLGMMIFVLSIGSMMLCFIHMIIHAFFKSMLFLSTGSIMMQISGSQDSRVYGGFFFSYSSLVYFFVSCFCLGGFPFFIGFYSKDLIISSSSLSLGVFSYYSFIVGCIFTLFYSLRIFLRVYFSSFKNVSYNLFCESLYFSLTVFLNFLSCWILGGMFYWFFLLSNVFFVSFFDFMMGLILIFLAFFFYKFLVFYYFLFVNLCYIYFMKWFSASGSSFSFNNMNFLSYESTWMELGGGMGVFYLLMNSNKVALLLDGIRLGMIFFASFVFIVYFL